MKEEMFLDKFFIIVHDTGLKGHAAFRFNVIDVANGNLFRGTAESEEEAFKVARRFSIGRLNLRSK